MICRMPAITWTELLITQFKTTRTTTTAITVWQVALGTLFHTFGAFLAATKATSTAWTYWTSRCNSGVTARAENPRQISHLAALPTTIEACSHELLRDTDELNEVIDESSKAIQEGDQFLHLLCCQSCASLVLVLGEDFLQRGRTPIVEKRTLLAESPKGRWIVF